MSTAKVLPEFSQISPTTAVRTRPPMTKEEEEEEETLSASSAVLVSPGREETITYTYAYPAQPASSFSNLQTLVEVASASAPGRLEDGGEAGLERGAGEMVLAGPPRIGDSGGAVHMVWEQESVRHLQAALNGQEGHLGQQQTIQPDLHLPQQVENRVSQISGMAMVRNIRSPAPPVLHHGSVSPDTPSAFDDNMSSTSAVSSSRPAAIESKQPRQKSGDKAVPKRRRRGGESDDGGVRPCAVCGEEAGRHSYYGGQVCASCRAFFRRSVTSGASKNYFCVKNKNCPVNSKTRKQCQYCRYRLCEDAGMKRSWVLTEKAAPVEGNPNKRKQKDADDPGAGFEASAAARAAFITETELTLINELVEISDILEPSKVNDMDTTLIREIIRMVAFKARLSDNGLKELATTLKARSRKVALRLREMQQLSQDDRDEILNKNIPILVKLNISTYFNPNKVWGNQLAGLLGSEEVEKLDKKLKTLQVKGLESYRLKYSQFFQSPFLEADESEQEFCQLLNKIGSWSEDPEEYILISILLLFCPDLLSLQDRARVEQIQSSLAELLHNYLNYRHGRERGRSKFASAMFLVSRCRQLHDLLNQHNIDFSQ